MSDYISAELVVIPFSSKARERVLSIDMNSFELPSLSRRSSYWGDCLRSKGDIEITNTGIELIEEISSRLQGDGVAYISIKCEEDIPFAIIGYDLGEGVKYVYFYAGMPEDVLYFEVPKIQAMQKMTTEQLMELYKGLHDIKNVKKVPKEYSLEMFHEMVEYFGDDVDSIEYVFQQPYAAELKKIMLRNAEECSTDEYGFYPSMLWEEKGIVQFSDTERNNLAQACNKGVLQ